MKTKHDKILELSANSLIKDLQAENEALRQENKRLRQALEYRHHRPEEGADIEDTEPVEPVEVAGEGVG